MAQNYYESFKKKLEEIFMMDHAELDFGIYRIMNQKRNDIQRFLDLELLPQVKQVLEGNNGGEADKAKKRMAEIAASVGGNIEVLPKGTPMRDEYDKLEAQLAQSADTESMQAEVFSHLVTFFSRYYDGGDFLSKRRYKDNTYAIPYNGEEVKLHWANSDQYYIKTSEYFRDYTFVLPTSRKKVHFVLKDASTEQNNNRAANNMERRFALWQPTSEDEQSTPLAIRRGAGGEAELDIYFTYELMPKATKQDALKAEAFETVKPLIPAEYEELLTTKVPTQKEPNRTLLEKHLTDYTAKNSFDYFIHKDLGGFLHRELDFYIKNEVLHIDDLDAQFINSQLTIVRAIKQVGEKIIRMLAQLENFQKKLWLKKKFVVQSDYCITLDRVPEKLYPEIIANEAQRKEWVRLFAIDEIKGDLTTEGYSEPLTIEFLKQNPFLVLDTAFFDAKFKHQLVKSMENIDEQTNGLLINSENFQALELLQEKYAKSVKCVYIDPPYNTGNDGFAYKDRYQHSSWLSMISDRISLGRCFVNDTSNFIASIDEAEQPYLRDVMDDVFGKENYIADMVWAAGRKNDSRFVSISHEYMIVYASNRQYLSDKKIEWKQKKKGLDDIYNTYERLKKQYGKDYNAMTEALKEWYKSLPDSHPAKSHKHYNRIDENGVYFPSDISWPGGGGPRYEVLHPVTGKPVAVPSRGWLFPTKERMDEIISKGLVAFGEDEKSVPTLKSYLKDREFQAPYSVFYQDGRAATKRLRDVMGNEDFGFPKDETVIADTISLNSGNDDLFFDYFAGSGTTAHAIINLNREDKGSRKYMLCEMANYFNKVTRPRIEKIVYSSDWRDGKPVSRNGVSQCFKYIRLEQYEDTLNNLEIKKQQTDWRDDEFHESYMLSYMLDTETRDSLLNLKMFVNPFNMSLKTTKDNELVETKVDMVETFNYLIGLNVETEDWFENDNICVIQGKTHRGGLETLVIWRNCEKINNEALCDFFRRRKFNTRDSEYKVIYVNGDNTLPNLRRDEENWKVVLTEEEFAKRMFEEE